MKLNQNSDNKSDDLDADILKQGDSYEEEELDYEGGKLNSLPIERKYIVLGAGILVVVLLIVVAYKFLNKEEPKTTAASKTVQEIVNTTEPAKNTDKKESTQPATSPTKESKIVDETKYTNDDLVKLRGAGFTGEEIEQMQSEGKSVDSALSDSKIAKAEYLRDLYPELKPKVTDSTSEAYKTLLKNTWLGGDYRPVAKDPNVMYTAKTVRENSRYVREAPNGGQLQIKLTLKNGDIIFLNVHPERYEKLDDEGNMVIDYDDVTYGNYHYYINIKEVPIT